MADMNGYLNSAEQHLLAAKDAAIANLKELESNLEWLSAACNLIHQLQRERGLTNIWLVSEGARKRAEREAQLKLADKELERFCAQISDSTDSGRLAKEPKLLASLAQLMLSLSTLAHHRTEIQAMKLQPLDATLGYNHLIQQILTLIFDLAETAREPKTARAMIALVHLIQVKELAGQERAWTAIGFARGNFVERLCQRLARNQSDTAQMIAIFQQSAAQELLTSWQQIEASSLFSEMTQLRGLRTQLCKGQSIDPAIAEAWYDKATEYIDQLALLEAKAIQLLDAECRMQIDDAQRSKVKIERHLQELIPSKPVDPLSQTSANDAAIVGTQGSLYQLISEQNAQIQQLQVDLTRARTALQERKLIERAKEILKQQMKLDDDAAYRQLQKSAMDSGRSVADVAARVLEAMAKQVEK